jgi:hypothetical protein
VAVAQWPTLLQETMALLGAEYPLDLSDRGRVLESDDVLVVLEELNRQFFELEASTDTDGSMGPYFVGDDGEV